MVTWNQLLEQLRCARINLVDNGMVLAGRIIGTAQIDGAISEVEAAAEENGESPIYVTQHGQPEKTADTVVGDQ